MDLKTEIREYFYKIHGSHIETDIANIIAIAEKHIALQLQQGGVSGSVWIEVLSDHEITEYSKKLEPIWIILEEDETKTPILCQPDGHDNYYGSDDIIYHYCDISHFMKIQRPVF